MGAGGRPQTSRHNLSRGIHHLYLSRPLWRLSYQNSRSKETLAILPEVHMTARVQALQQHSERRDPSISGSPPFDLLPTFILTNDYQRNTPYMDLKVCGAEKLQGRNEPMSGQRSHVYFMSPASRVLICSGCAFRALPNGNGRTR